MPAQHARFCFGGLAVAQGLQLRPELRPGVGLHGAEVRELDERPGDHALQRTSPLPATVCPMRKQVSPRRARSWMTSPASDCSTMSTIPTPMLKTRYASST